MRNNTMLPASQIKVWKAPDGRLYHTSCAMSVELVRGGDALNFRHCCTVHGCACGAEWEGAGEWMRATEEETRAHWENMNHAAGDWEGLS